MKIVLQTIVVSAFVALSVGCGSGAVAIGQAGDSPQSPLFVAIETGDLNAVKEQIASDRSLLDLPEGDLKQTPIHKAVRAKRFDVAQFLVESGADVNARDLYGMTPLTLAMDLDAGEEMIQFLESNGGDD